MLLAIHQAPSVRHIRSPGSLQSGDPGLEGDHQMWEHRRCDIPAIEFWVRWIATYGASCLRGILLPQGNATHSHGATDMPPRNGAELYLWKGKYHSCNLTWIHLLIFYDGNKRNWNQLIHQQVCFGFVYSKGSDIYKNYWKMRSLKKPDCKHII